MIGTKQEQQLKEGLAVLGLTLDDAKVARLLTYLALLLKWNKTYSLTAITEPERMVSHHLLDSLAALAPIAAVQPRRLLDVGSGGGQPGIPFAILQPDWKITLLDSNHKKTTFLRQAVIELDLQNVQVICDRVENVPLDGGFDLITSRAFADLTDFVRLTKHLLANNGRWAALKGVQPFEEIASLPADINSHVMPLDVPDLGAERCIVWMEVRA
ncbi:16S rRNA (guanine(527)-N(7))-methyltransferase RsmG [Chitinimonas sp. BJB300]|uniref:16S rRNA (guanine(527)-N(7))-methyltransferase RsmG n=1 Tax=Chitinimonas sp. BJB300 TaxID=1559339 RepID=UPI000C0F3C5A|nr:16S rRNA (guanine(527)-N(7))-methyltransferase RsmG [Chitinimonas sp. BJB300]PHV12683.1 16S rRNA (guanine(527)-N(7))-methyltransferase RsmG [Chitinimonas sp. BJB300]TSJ91273.1 16S rRNA (guanine(527)-N(7))-methyltransferase RsmG [Chitinimonas sp. BJB300]